MALSAEMIEIFQVTKAKLQLNADQTGGKCMPIYSRDLTCTSKVYLQLISIQFCKLLQLISSQNETICAGG